MGGHGSGQASCPRLPQTRTKQSGVSCAVCHVVMLNIELCQFSNENEDSSESESPQ